MNGTKRAFRLVVQRWPKEQPELFDLEPYFYHVIASGGVAEEEEDTPEEVVAFYNQRGEIENWIKELKDGFGMDWMPCGETFANAVYFRLGVIAYNLFVAMKVLSLPGRWQRYTISTVRWRSFFEGRDSGKSAMGKPSGGAEAGDDSGEGEAAVGSQKERAEPGNDLTGRIERDGCR
ncbi:MAG: transposase [Chloroflexi bacterium]|nr:transposase [Chloroflexota bacterium]